MLPYLLFAYREVPQASTCFLPFELLYGRPVNGPLDVLRQLWEVSPRSKENVTSHILSMRDKMEKMADVVKKNMEQAQEKQKRWYDKPAAHRQFESGNHVLVLLPTDTNKLLAEWQGPYEVLKQVGRVNYQIDTYDRKKRKRIFHVNMLRPWHTPQEDTAYFSNDVGEEGEDIPVWSERPAVRRTAKYITEG